MGYDFNVITIIEIEYRKDGETVIKSILWKQSGNYFHDESDDEPEVIKTNHIKQLQRSIKPEKMLYKNGNYTSRYYVDKYKDMIDKQIQSGYLITARKYMTTELRT